MYRHCQQFILLITILFLPGGCGYNSLQVKEEAVFKAWANIESAIQRRADLIPNLVATVQGYASHEKETLEAVINARAKASQIQISAKDLGNALAMQKFQHAQGSLGSALGRLMAVAERYPDLKANQNFLDLQNQLEGTENRINVARQRYNAVVEQFNAAIRQIPESITNNLLLHLERKEYFKATTEAQQVPKVKF